MPALLAQLFAFQLAWGAPPPPPSVYVPPPVISPRRATYEALCYCRDRGLACRPDGTRLLRGGVWRVRMDVKHRRHYWPRHREMVLDIDGRSGAVLGVYDVARRASW